LSYLITNLDGTDAFPPNSFKCVLLKIEIT